MINMLKGYWQQRFGYQVIEACRNDGLNYPVRTRVSKKEEKPYWPYIPSLIFVQGSTEDQPVYFGTDNDKNATLETEFPIKTQMEIE
ncbi:MAG: hypothetical protein GY821_06965 [Gammaproteobacteria bacterium]|nr:hypothetical protein [Gammaproteobacteria bacterium]